MASVVGSRKKDKRTTLQDFELSVTLGTGTFGRVLLAKDRRGGEYYALKIMNISEVIRLKQVEHVQNEKTILMKIDHPFIVNLLWTHHDQTFLYMLLEYACGGELFTYLRTAGRFNNGTGLFYGAEIVSALDYLHSMSMVYRDLKPENILLDREGHVKITDFGFAKEVHDKTWTLCGTPEYLAPEIIQSKGHNKAVDWWALGILIYEMLVGYPPFFDDNPFGIYEKILSGKVEWPKHMENTAARDLIKRLLVHDRTRRLGSMKLLVYQQSYRSVPSDVIGRTKGILDGEEIKWRRIENEGKTVQTNTKTPLFTTNDKKQRECSSFPLGVQ